MDDDRTRDLGERLSDQASWLTYLLSHLAGRAIRRRLALEDLVQDVYLRAIIAREHVPPPEDGEPALRRYLAVVARRAVLDAARALRAAKRSGQVVTLARSDGSASGDPLAEAALAATGAVTAVVAREQRSTMLAAFEALVPEHRRVIGHRQFEGLSAAETATRMGRSETAVHSLYRRALEAWDRGQRAER